MEHQKAGAADTCSPFELTLSCHLGLSLHYKNTSVGANLDNGDPGTVLFSMTRFFKFLPRKQRHAFLGSLSERIVSMIGPDPARLRSDSASYELLRQHVLRRDGWRVNAPEQCQISKSIISNFAATEEMILKKI